eukprot:2651315-Rhodomonas_salina.1
MTYWVSGTELAYATGRILHLKTQGTRNYLPGTARIATSLCACYALSNTDLAYAAISLRARSMKGPVLT